MDCLKMNLSSDNKLPRVRIGEEQIDQRLTSFNSRYTFSAKEKDIETGYSYFGARYYTSDLSIWLSVDPLSDNTPFATPYAYCINNPIILHDPNGEDWFENENTGGIYYDKDLKNAKTLGEGWKRIGDNDMFGSSANEAIRGNQDLGEIYTISGDDVGRAEFKGVNAEKFMDKMGYDLKPLEADVHTSEKTYRFAEGDGSINRTDKTEDLESVKSWTYAKKGSNESYSVLRNYKKAQQSINIFECSSTRDTYETRQYHYGSKSTKTSDFIKNNFWKIASGAVKIIF